MSQPPKLGDTVRISLRPAVVRVGRKWAKIIPENLPPDAEVRCICGHLKCYHGATSADGEWYTNDCLGDDWLCPCGGFEACSQ